MRDLSESCLGPVDDRLFVQPSGTAVLDQQLISAFWEKYIPLHSHPQGDSACVWLQQAIWLQNPGEVLQVALKALATTRLAWINKDETLAQQGSMWYGRALQFAQKALWRENAVENDDIFVAGYVLAVYEVIFSYNLFSWIVIDIL